MVSHEIAMFIFNLMLYKKNWFSIILNVLKCINSLLMFFYILDIPILLTVGLILCCSVLESVYTVWFRCSVAFQKGLSPWIRVQGDCSPKTGVWSQAALISPNSHSFKSTKCKCKVEWKVLASGRIILNKPIIFSMHSCTWLDSESSSYMSACNWYE